MRRSYALRLQQFWTEIHEENSSETKLINKLGVKTQFFVFYQHKVYEIHYVNLTDSTICCTYLWKAGFSAVISI